MNTYAQILFQKKLAYAVLPNKGGDSRVLARQLDSALMENGFKLSKELLTYLGKSQFDCALGMANEILTNVKVLIGAHVKHNPYFISFPKNVPDTFEFWGGLLARYYEATGTVTFNLLDFPTYGRVQHSFEEMEALHDKLTLKKGHNLKVIHLARSLKEELQDLYRSLAGSPVPLSTEDRELLARIYTDCYAVSCSIPVRENKAIINALSLEAGNSLDVDTVVDVLRLAAHLSGGDVTLLKPTKFKSFKRSYRRAMLLAINELVHRDERKIDDVNHFKEQFKRLGEKLHPGEYPEYGFARRVFDFATGRVQVDTFGHQVHTALAKGKETGNFTKALKVLGERPGLLAKNLDFILRESDDHEKVIAALKKGGDAISGRNLLGVYQHLQNRTRSGGSRIFVNRAGKGFSTENTLPRFTKTALKPVQTALFSALKPRIPVVDNLVVDWDSIKGIALPLSEKTKAEGFEVLPRGSVMDLSAFKGGSSLRFFVYWHQKAERTDYDLSVQFYDKDFNNTGQVSWTSLRYGGGDKNATITHSGDITDATSGATEFIDIKLDQVGSEVAYIVPSINLYAGEAFKDTKECFFGYMERPADKGQPFEARTVKTKFAVRGEGGAAIPMVFARGEQGWYGKWMDLYMKGRDLGNRVEANKYSTLGLMKAILEKEYLEVTELVELYADKAGKTTKVDKIPDKPVTFIGLRRPEGLHPESKVYTLEQFKELIPQ